MEDRYESRSITDGCELPLPYVDDISLDIQVDWELIQYGEKSKRWAGYFQDKYGVTLETVQLDSFLRPLAYEKQWLPGVNRTIVNPKLNESFLEWEIRHR